MPPLGDTLFGSLAAPLPLFGLAAVTPLPLALELPERSAAFFWVGDPGRSMLGLWSLGSAPLGMSLHVAFDVALADVLEAPERLKALGVVPLSAWMPAAAVYFRDPDGHLLEYLTMLDEAPEPELGILTWPEWLARRGP